MAKGGFLMVLLRLSMRSIGLISTMILFRILVPEDFGLVSLAMTVVGLIDVLAEFGFDLALIQKAEASRDDYDTTWTLTLIRGLLCSTLLICIAEPAGDFLADARLSEMITWLALAPLMDGLQNIGVIEFQKELQFGREFVFKISQKLIGFFVTLALAVWLRSYWALLIGILSNKAVNLLLSYLLHPFRPRVNLTQWRSIFRFTKWIMFHNIVLYAGTQTDKVLIKKYTDAHTVGIFRVAEELCSVTMELVWPVEKALFPGFSKLARNPVEISRTMLNAQSLVSMIGLPVSIGLGLVADPLVSILFGEKGHEAVPFIQVLTLHGAIRSCATAMPPVFLAMGKPSVGTIAALTSVSVRLALLFALIPTLGVIAAAWSLVAASVTSFTFYWVAASRVLRLAWWRIPSSFWRSLVATAAMIALVLRTNELHALLPIHNDWTVLGGRVIVGASTYILTIWLLWLASGVPEGPERQVMRFIRSRFLPVTTT